MKGCKVTSARDLINSIEEMMQSVLIAVQALKLKDNQSVHIEEKKKVFLVRLFYTDTEKPIATKLIKKSLIVEGIPNDILQRLKDFEKYD